MSKKSKPPVRRPYDPAAAGEPPRRAWVPLDKGDVCVHEMTLAETMQITERAARPSIDPRGGHSRGQAVALQIMLSCHYGEEEGSPRIFSDADYAAIHALKFHEFDGLLQAINEVSGKSASEAERLRDFTQAMEGVTTPC